MNLRKWMGEPFKAEAELMALLVLGVPFFGLVVAVIGVLYFSHCSPSR